MYIPKISSAAYIAPGLIPVYYNQHDLVKDVCKYHDLTLKELKAKNNQPHFVQARDICCLLIDERFLSITRVGIGKLVNLNHSSVTQAIQRIKLRI